MTELTSRKEKQMIYFMCLLIPIMDIYKCIVGNKFEILGISLVEIFNALYVLTFAGILIKKALSKYNCMYHVRKTAIYAAIFIIYMGLHLFNISKFNTDLLSTASTSYVTEIYHIVIAYVLPLVLLYIFSNIQFSHHDIAKALMYTGVCISIVIVITNILKVSFLTYASYYDDYTIIEGGIFSWGKNLAFVDDINLYTSRGFFYSGNQISAVLSGLTFLTAIMSSQKGQIRYNLFLSLDFLALLMLSTKTALLCIFLCCTVMLLFPLYYYFRTKENLFQIKTVLLPILLAVVMISLYSISPAKYKINEYIDNATEDFSSINIACSEPETAATESEAAATESANKESSESEYTATTEIMQIEQETLNSELSHEEHSEPDNKTDNAEQSGNNYPQNEQELLNLIKNAYSSFGIPREFVELYNVDQHSDFWKNLVQLPYSEVSNFRKVKMMIYQDLLKKNGNATGDRLLGIGYTSGFPEIERDILTQNVLYGYLGTAIFVLPFFAIFLFCGIKLMIYAKKYRDIEYYGLVLTSGYILAASLITGHVFANFVPMAVLAYTNGTLLSKMRNNSSIISKCNHK